MLTPNKETRKESKSKGKFTLSLKLSNWSSVGFENKPVVAITRFCNLFTLILCSGAWRTRTRWGLSVQNTMTSIYSSDKIISFVLRFSMKRAHSKPQNWRNSTAKKKKKETNVGPVLVSVKWALWALFLNPPALSLHFYHPCLSFAFLVCHLPSIDLYCTHCLCLAPSLVYYHHYHHHHHHQKPSFGPWSEPLLLSGCNLQYPIPSSQ